MLVGLTLVLSLSVNNLPPLLFSSNGGSWDPAANGGAMRDSF